MPSKILLAAILGLLSVGSATAQFTPFRAVPTRVIAPVTSAADDKAAAEKFTAKAAADRAATEKLAAEKAEADKAAPPIRSRPKDPRRRPQPTKPPPRPPPIRARLNDPQRKLPPTESPPRPRRRNRRVRSRGRLTKLPPVFSAQTPPASARRRVRENAGQVSSRTTTRQSFRNRGECPCECAHALSACRSISVAQLGLLRSRSIASWLSPGVLVTGSSPALIALSIACAHARESWDAAQPGSMLHHNRDASETRSLPASFQAA